MAEVAREPLVQEIRLTWWAEAIDEVFADRPPRRHPVVEALAVLVSRRGPPRAPFEAMIEARLRAIDKPVLADEAAVHGYIAATAGALMGLAVGVVDNTGPADTEGVARPWGLAGLARLRSVGIDRLPKAWSDGDVRRRVGAAMAEARRAARHLPVAAFPAVAYATLARCYAAGRTPSELERRGRITAAVLTGWL